MNDIIARKRIRKNKTSIDSLKAENANMTAGARVFNVSEKISRDTYWNTDPSNGVNGAWSDRQIALLGDSHLWGEGSPNYQGISTGYTLHQAWIHNKGFGNRLIEYLYNKFDTQPWRVVPLYDWANMIPKQGTGATAYTGSYISAAEAVVDKKTFTRKPRVIKGKYYTSVFGAGSITQQSDKDALNAFCSSLVREDAYAMNNYSYNSDVGLFGRGVLNFAPDAGASAVLFDMDKPSRYAIVHFTGGTVVGAKVKIELLNHLNCNNDGSEKWDQVVTSWGDKNYGTAAPSVYMLNVNGDNTSTLVPAGSNVTVSDYYIDIDTSTTGLPYETYYVIDFKQKKKSTLRMSHNGNGTNFTTPNGILSSSSVATRGVLFGNRDLIRNWGMGGHTTGAWLGLEDSYSAEKRNHIADIKAYHSGSLKALIIEAPIVNEYLKQTPIATYKERLTAITTALNCNTVLIFTTLGLKAKEFSTDNGTIKFDDYANATKEWAESATGDVTFVDCREYLKGLVSSGVIEDYNHLYINNGHPSPLSNETIFEMLTKVVDMKF